MTLDEFVIARLREDDPPRMVHEDAAMRAIVRRCAAVKDEPDQYPNGLVSPRATLARQVLIALAAIWSDHPDYAEDRVR
jgi:hypothetical protein